MIKGMRRLLLAPLVASVCVFALVVFLQPKAVNVDEFAALTRTDPLFYSPFFDAEGFSASIRALKESEARLKRTALANIKENARPNSAAHLSLLQQYELFPHQYLFALADIPPATEVFLSKPTPEGARKLIALYERAAKEYEKAGAEGLAALEDMKEASPPNRPLLYFFADSATSLDIVKNDYHLIQKNGVALQEEVARRKACLLGEGACEVLATPRDTADFLSALETPAPNLEQSTARFVKETLPQIHPEQTIRGPYPVASSCWQGEAPHWLYLIYTKEGIQKVLPKLATQNYYLLVPKNASDALTQAFTDAGHVFYSQPEATTYECTDLTFYPRLLALDFVQTQIDTKLISKEGVSSNPELTLFARNQFGVLAPALNLLASVTDLLETSQRVSTDNVLSPELLFVARSAYSLTFMPFAQSVWRIDEQPTYLLSEEEHSRIQAPPQFKTYTELKAYGFTDEEIRGSHVNQKEFIESLSH